MAPELIELIKPLTSNSLQSHAGLNKLTCLNGHSPGHEDVDEALVGVEFGGDVVFDPLVDCLRGRVCLDLLQQLLLQLQQGEQEAQTLPLQDLQHAVLVLVDLWKEEGKAKL